MQMARVGNSLLGSQVLVLKWSSPADFSTAGDPSTGNWSATKIPILHLNTFMHQYMLIVYRIMTHTVDSRTNLINN